MSVQLSHGEVDPKKWARIVGYVQYLRAKREREAKLRPPAAPEPKRAPGRPKAVRP